MAWLRVSVTAPRGRADATEQQLRDAGAVAVSLLAAASAEAVVEPAPDAFPLWDVVRVEGLFPTDCDLAALDGLHADADFVAERDWSETWRHGHGPMRFGRLHVVPRDHVGVPARADQAVIRLDPGLAFGTGTHPSTALCLRWLGQRRLAGQRVLDVGCGSGILAIAAARLGAQTVVAVDHDAQARQAARSNALANGVTLTVFDDLSRASGRFDLAIANIVANTLCAMAPNLTSARTLVLSGILADQVPAVVNAYPGVRFSPPALSDGWALLAGERHG